MENKIAIIDADLIANLNKHRFPNLASMKLSAYYKSLGYIVILKLDYKDLDLYEKVFISKVFTSTYVPEEVLNLSNVNYGGTGFFYDKAIDLPKEIEHMMPDYHLYDDWVEKRIKSGESANALKYYTDYSIGFLTRGCFRQCSFCVNQKYKTCFKHSNIEEFHDNTRPKLCFLDDNFLACPEWKEIIDTVKALNKPFQFKQGLDERLLTPEKIQEVFSWKYDGDYIFAFDDLNDKKIIESKLKMIYNQYPNLKKKMKFYVLVGYDRDNKYDSEFWKQDIENAFRRIFILARYSACPYIMRYEKCYTSEWNGFYTILAAWCNQVSFFWKMSFEIFSKAKGMSDKDYKKYKTNFELYLKEVGKKGASWRYYEELINKYPQFEKVTKVIPETFARYGGRKLQ